MDNELNDAGLNDIPEHFRRYNMGETQSTENTAKEKTASPAASMKDMMFFMLVMLVFFDFE